MALIDNPLDKLEITNKKKAHPLDGVGKIDTSSHELSGVGSGYSAYQAPSGLPKDPSSQSQSLLGDVGRELGAGAVTGSSMLVRGAGELMQGGGDLVSSALNLGTDAVNPLEGAADAMDKYSADTLANVSDETKLAKEKSLVTGDIFDPETVKMGEDPSMRGLVAHTANTVGQLVPQIVGGVAARGTALVKFGIDGVLGYIQGTGGGALESGQFIDSMDDNELAEHSGYFRDLVDGGMSITRARERAKQRAELGGGLGMGAATGVSQAVENAIVRSFTKGKVSNGGRINKAVKGIVGGASIEGTQEVAESIVSKSAQNVAIEGDASLTEGSATNFFLGALGGGAAGGAFSQLPSGTEGNDQPEGKKEAKTEADFSDEEIAKLYGSVKNVDHPEIEATFKNNFPKWYGENVEQQEATNEQQTQTEATQTQDSETGGEESSLTEAERIKKSEDSIVNALANAKEAEELAKAGAARVKAEKEAQDRPSRAEQIQLDEKKADAVKQEVEAEKKKNDVSFKNTEVPRTSVEEQRAFAEKLNAPKPKRKVNPKKDNIQVAIDKNGGLKMDDVEGVDLDVIGKNPMYRVKGGLSLDDMATALAADGYLGVDEHGKPDVKQLQELMDKQLRGEDVRAKVYYDSDEYAQQQAEDYYSNEPELGMDENQPPTVAESATVETDEKSAINRQKVGNEMVMEKAEEADSDLGLPAISIPLQHLPSKADEKAGQKPEETLNKNNQKKYDRGEWVTVKTDTPITELSKADPSAEYKKVNGKIRKRKDPNYVEPTTKASLAVQDGQEPVAAATKPVEPVKEDTDIKADEVEPVGISDMLENEKQVSTESQTTETVTEPTVKDETEQVSSEPSKEKPETASQQEAPVKKTEKSLPEEKPDKEYIAENIPTIADELAAQLNKNWKKVKAPDVIKAREIVAGNHNLAATGFDDADIILGNALLPFLQLNSSKKYRGVKNKAAVVAIIEQSLNDQLTPIKLSEIALPDTTKTVEVDGVEYEVNQTADEAISDIDKRLDALHELKACLNG